MRRVCLSLLVVLGLIGTAHAQVINQIAISAQDAGSCATAKACATFPALGANPSFVIGVTGTWSGTLTIQIQADGATWTTAQVTKLSDGTRVTTTTANDNFGITNPGLTGIRVVGTSLASGTATVTLTSGRASASGGTGGGGSSITGGTCTNQAVTALNTSGVPTCTTLTSAYKDTSIASTGVDINTSYQVTATHLAAALPVNQGGTALISGTSGGVLGYTAAGTLASSAALAANAPVIGGGAGATPTAVTAGNAGQVFAGTGTAGAPAFVGGVTLLHAGSGTDTSASATTVDSFAISGLTANDTLIIELVVESAANTTAQPLIYSVTDSATITAATPSSLTAGVIVQNHIEILPRQGSATLWGATLSGATVSSGVGISTGGLYTASTAWTGSWTMGLRHGGVTAGGTFKYAWRVYRMAGQ